MTSQGTQGSTVGHSIHNLISGVEEVLRTAEPAKAQLRRLESYMRQLQTQDVDEELKALRSDNIKLRKDLMVLQARLQNTTENPHPAAEDFRDAFDPLKIAELYKNLYDKHWPDAYEQCEKLSYGYGERFIVDEVRSIFEKAETFCKEELERQKLVIKDILKDKSVDGKNLDEAHVITLIRNWTTDLSLGLIVQAFRREKDADYFTGRKLNACPIFVRECVRICWLAKLCEPPIASSTKRWGDEFDENLFRVYTRKGKKVDFVVLPALVSADGRHVVAKGVVQCEQ